MQTIIWNHLSETEKRKVIMRPVQQNGKTFSRQLMPFVKMWHTMAIGHYLNSVKNLMA